MELLDRIEAGLEDTVPGTNGPFDERQWINRSAGLGKMKMHVY
jgi:hypothetical protein